MAWLYLGLAAAFEVLFAISMKQSEGFTRLWPTLLTILGVVCGIPLLTLALKTLPVSVAYPIWVGVGTLGTVLFGVLVLQETMSLVTAASIAAILLGVIGLKMSFQAPDVPGTDTTPAPAVEVAPESD